MFGSLQTGFQLADEDKAVHVHAIKKNVAVDVCLFILNSAIHGGELSASRHGRLYPRRSAPGTV